MKIAFIANYLRGYHSHAGGAEKAIQQTAELAQKKGNEVFFVTLPFDGEQDAESFSGAVYGVPVTETVFPFLKKYIEILKWYLSQFDPVSYFSILKLLKREKPDIVHLGNFQFLTFSAVSAAKKLGIPVILSVYDYWYFCPSTSLFDKKNRICRDFHGARCVGCLPSEFSIIQSALLFFRKMVFDRFLGKIDRFIALSWSSADIIRSYGIGKERIETIRLPFVRPEWRNWEPAGAGGEYILFTGWLQTRKGLHVLLDAMPKIWKRMPAIMLRVLAQKVKWEKDYEELIESKLKTLPADKIVFELGAKNKADVNGFIHGAAVVAVPEQWENMSPLIVIESMSLSKAVVASDIGGIPELVEHEKTGLLSKTGDASDLAENILRFLEDKQFADECGKRAKQKAMELFDPAAIADSINEEYLKWKKR
ncbi:MAG: glycosyltransferase family 4 protein [Elusimicrobiota bacterium]